MAGKNKKSQNKSGMALACWILGFLVILIIFLVKQDEIISNLKSTRFFDRVFGKTPSFVEHHEDKLKKQNENSIIKIVTEDAKSASEKSDSASSQGQKASPSVSAENEKAKAAAEAAKKAQEAAAEAAKQLEQAATEAAKKAAEEKAKAAAAEAAKKAQEAAAEAAKQQALARQTTQAKLYFVAIGSDGSVSRKEMVRTITKTDSPLSENIRQLLKGPNQSEKAKGCMSLVPDGTRLLSATVHDGTAFLSFSEEFEYNRVGVEGYLGQLMQIVYTATEFGTVDSVQILIQGKKQEYLGSEGVWIGSPLSRSSFK